MRVHRHYAAVVPRRTFVAIAIALKAAGHAAVMFLKLAAINGRQLNPEVDGIRASWAFLSDN
jgi:hypothetical protein